MALQDITKPMALDETLQATNEILGDIRDAMGIRYKVVHTAAANQTYAQQLAELYPYINALSVQDEIHSAILIGNMVLHNQNQMYKSYSGAVTDTSKNISVHSIRLYDNANRTVVYSLGIISASGVSLTDKINDTNTGTMSLVLI